MQLNKHEPHSPCIDALSFVLIFPHISATISEEAHRRVLLPCPPGIIENYRKKRKHKETPMKVMYDKNNIGLTK